MAIDEYSWKLRILNQLCGLVLHTAIIVKIKFYFIKAVHMQVVQVQWVSEDCLLLVHSLSA